MNIDDIKILFWESKGITDHKTLSVEEKRCFIVELKAYIEGFRAGENNIKTGDKND